MRRIKVAMWSAAAALGFVQAWANRHTMYPDGISYLDLGDAFVRGDWAGFINGYWSPIYPALLGLTNAILRPTPFVEFTVVHLVNWAVYLTALGCFHFLLVQLIRHHAADADRARSAKFPTWCWLVLGYVLFVWTMLRLIGLQETTPDVALAAIVFLATGLVLRIRLGAGLWTSFGWLGLVLAAGYLTKVAMFPFAFLFLGVAWFSAGGLRRTMPQVLVALGMFVLVGGPWALALSATKGRLTYGDSGRLNYTWGAREVRPLPDGAAHWSLSSDAVLVKQTRQLLTVPAVYEFGSRIGGTYPIWFDPSYWHSDLMSHVVPEQRLRIVAGNLSTYYRTVIDLNGSLVTGLVVLMLWSRRGRLVFADVARYWFLLVPAVGALALYSVVYTFTRYLAPFVVLLFLGLFAGVRLPRSEASVRLVGAVAIAVLGMFALSMGPPLAEDGVRTVRHLLGGAEPPSLSWQLATGLRQMGLQEGDRVAYLKISSEQGVTGFTHAKWARLARVRIVAAIYSDDTEPESQLHLAVQAVTDAGATVIVAQQLGEWARLGGWQRIVDTDYFAYFPSK